MGRKFKLTLSRKKLLAEINRELRSALRGRPKAQKESLQIISGKIIVKPSKARTIKIGKRAISV